MGLGDGGSLGFGGRGVFVGEGAGFGIEELGVISRRGADVDVVLLEYELSFSSICSRGVGTSSSRYMRDTWVSSLFDKVC